MIQLIHIRDQKNNHIKYFPIHYFPILRNFKFQIREFMSLVFALRISRKRDNSQIISILVEILTIKFSDKIKHHGLLYKRGNKTAPLSECLPLAVDRAVIASNALRGNARARDMCTHMPFLLGAQVAGRRRDRPEINRNCNGPVTQYHLFRTIQWIGLMRCGSATNGGGYRNSRAARTHTYTHANPSLIPLQIRGLCSIIPWSSRDRNAIRVSLCVNRMSDKRNIAC